MVQGDAAIGFLHVLHALRPSTAEILVAELIGVRQDTGHHVLLHRLPEGKGGQTFLQLSQPSVQVRFDRCWQEKAGVVGAEVVQVKVYRPLNEGGHAPASILLKPALQNGFLFRGEIEGESLFFAHKLLLSGA